MDANDDPPMVSRDDEMNDREAETTGTVGSTVTHTKKRTARRLPKELRDLQDFNKAPPSKEREADTESTTPSSVEEEENAKRTRRRSSAAAAAGQTSTKPKPKQQNSRKEQDHLDMAWICVACREAECAMDPEADLLVCEGLCRRLFHVPCAGLPQMPDADQVWKCHDCLHGRHLCAFCQEYGLDNEDVFKCQKNQCGFFFHEACLEMQNIAIDARLGQEVLDAEAPPTDIPKQPFLKFTCPAHWCWTCTQDDLKIAEGRTPKNGRAALFSCKRDTRLFPCLECPTSYHLTCIPPVAKFHELALLCHEHADKAQLPALDMEASYQCTVEARCDQKLKKLRNWDNLLSKRAKHTIIHWRKKPSKNPFFPSGVDCDSRTIRERFVMDKLGAAQILSSSKEPQVDHDSLVKVTTDWICASTGKSDRLLFCLPADVQEEVHSKPPLYKHIHSLKYYPDNRPKRIDLSKDACNCTQACDDHCLNRLLYTECFGGIDTDRGRANCRIGPTCGNRQLGLKQHVKKCQPRREKGKGWGLVTMVQIQKGSLVQEYLGDVIDEKEKERRLITWNLEHPNDPNYYIMCLSQGWYVDARETANMARFINHSCDPNCILLRFNVGGYMRDGIFALRDIEPGEFLSYDYHFDTKQGDKFVCRCGSANCRGTMKEKNLESAKKTKTKSQLWTEAKQQYEKDERFLAEMEDRAKQNATIAAELPGTSSQVARETGTSIKQEWVSNGVQKDRAAAIRNRIFLWRNAVKGSDFDARFRRYDPSTGKDGGAMAGAPMPRKRTRPAQDGNTSTPVATVDVIAALGAAKEKESDK